MNDFLYTYGENIFSQNGEDGINQKLFQYLEIKSGVVLEIGAWDGFHCSNCANFWSKDKNFKAVLIESTNRLNKNNLELEYENIECFNELVGSENSLESILDKSKFKVTNSNFVLASIDVDGPDLEVTESLGKYKPKILILEPNGDIIEKRNPEGVSLKEWIDWSEKNGYSFIGMSGFVGQFSGNLYFVRDDLKDKFPITKLDWDKRGILKGGGIVYE